MHPSMVDGHRRAGRLAGKRIEQCHQRAFDKTFPSMRFTHNLLTSIIGSVAVFALTAVSVSAAPPTAEDDAKIVGNWKVSPPGLERVYEISTGHNLKIVGGNVKDKTGRLTPRNDASYTVNLEGGAIERIAYVRADDQLVIEYFDNKKSMDLGLVKWKSPGIRMTTNK